MLTFLDRDLALRAAVEHAVTAALPHLQRALPVTRAVGVTARGISEWRRRLPVGAVLVVLSPRPTSLEAAWAVMAGATAYLSLDATPDRVAEALDRAARQRLHIEPETAAALLSLLDVVSHDDSTQRLALALRLARQGWPWPVSARDAGLEPGAAADALLQLVGTFPS